MLCVPAAWRPHTRQSSQAMASRSTGAPVTALSQSPAPKRSSSLSHAKRLESSTCS